MRVLALDLATVSGWALSASGIVTSGNADFTRYLGCKSKPAEHRGVCYAKFSRWLRDKLRDDKPDCLAYEQPGHFKSMAAVNVCVGMRGILMAFAAVHNLPVYDYAPSEIKKHFTGKGRADKPVMIAAAKARYPDSEVATDNEADALAMLALHLSKRGKQT